VKNGGQTWRQFRDLKLNGPLIEKIRGFNPNHLTPIAAHELLQQFKDEVKK